MKQPPCISAVQADIGDSGVVMVMAELTGVACLVVGCDVGDIAWLTDEMPWGVGSCGAAEYAGDV